jgi:hypothetical protein
VAAHAASACRARTGNALVLSRSREITFHDGSTIETPLLVPSLSSKGFSPIEVGEEKPLPAPAAALKLFTPDAFYDGLLISAYDIMYDQLLNPEVLRSEFIKSLYAIPRFLIIDSGWYEATSGSDLGEPYEEVRESREWTFESFAATVKSLDADVKAALVSYDSYAPYEKQIDKAQEFFTDNPRFVQTLMLKPPRARLYHCDHIKELVPLAKRLRAFDIIGVTEKELGNTIVNRLKTIADLADLLGEAEVDAPIHVFGGLDPLYTPLYFAAGAEIVDGLSWQRFGYHNGMAVHRDSLLLINRQFDKRLRPATLTVQADNLDAIRELSRDLKIFHNKGGDWSVLGKGRVLKPAYDAFLSARGKKHGR